MNIPLRPQYAWCMIGGAWLLFVVALFLPAVDRFVDQPGAIRGWQAALMPLMLFSWPGLVMMVYDWLAFVTLLLSLGFNLAMLLGPWIVLRDPERASRVAACLTPALVLPWFLSFRYTGQRFSGFYLWLLSIAIMSLGCWLLERAYSYSGNRYPYDIDE